MPSHINYRHHTLENSIGIGVFHCFEYPGSSSSHLCTFIDLMWFVYSTWMNFDFSPPSGFQRRSCLGCGGWPSLVSIFAKYRNGETGTRHFRCYPSSADWYARLFTPWLRPAVLEVGLKSHIIQNVDVLPIRGLLPYASMNIIWRVSIWVSFRPLELGIRSYSCFEDSLFGKSTKADSKHRAKQTSRKSQSTIKSLIN